MPKVKNLVISGGGISGIGILGILKYCFDLNILNDIGTYVGTSVGSIIALLLIIDYKYNDIYDLLMSFDLEKLTDNIDIDNFIINYGLEDSNKLIYVIKRLLEYKNISENITFNELYESNNKKLTVTGVCLSDCKLYYFNHELTPDMKVLTAIRISCSIPILFTPVKYDDKLWLDGGIIQNYPIEFCKNDIENTLGISIFDKCFNKCVQIDDVMDFMVGLMKCVAYGNNNLDISNYKNNTIKFTFESNSFANFKIDYESIKEMFDSGYECAKNQHNIIDQFIDNLTTINEEQQNNDSLEQSIDSNSISELFINSNSDSEHSINSEPFIISD